MKPRHALQSIDICRAHLARRGLTARLSLALVAVASIRAAAQDANATRDPVPPQIVAAPSLSIPAAIGAPEPLALAPVGEAASPAAPATVGDAMRSVVSGQLWSGALSPDEAWQNGALTADDVLYLLQQSVGTNGPKNEEVRRDLAALLVQHAPKRIKDTDRLSAMTRLALAHYYSTEKDARAVKLCEELIRELDVKLQSVKQQGKEKQAEVTWPWLWSIIYLSEYYQKIGAKEKAAQTWLRSEPYFRDVLRDQQSAAGIVIEAARLYAQMGGKENGQKAKELYNRVPQLESGWMTGMSLLDQVEPLFAQHKYREAQRILSSPINGQDKDQGQIISLSLLAFACYRLKDFTKSSSYAKEAISKFETIDYKTARQRGLDHAISKAYDCLSWIDVWENALFRYTQQELVIPTDKNFRKSNLSYEISIQTFPEAELVVMSSNPNLTVRLNESSTEQDDGFSFSVNRKITIDSPLVHTINDLTASITVTEIKFSRVS